MKYIIIDHRMREIEKSLLKNLGYALIEIPKSDKVYPEISSHVDIFACKINNTIFAPKSIFDTILKQIEPLKRDVSNRSVRNSVKIIQKM